MSPDHVDVAVACGASTDGCVSTDPVRCASVLKPLVFWAAGGLAPYADDQARWAELARPAIVASANEPTTQAWQDCGADALLDRLAVLGGTRWSVEAGGVRSFGRVLVRAVEVASAYAALARAGSHGDVRAQHILGWMRSVDEAQTFGLRDVAADLLGVGREVVAVKCGWFSDRDETRIRTHAVTLTDAGGATVVTAVLTALPISDQEHALYTEMDEAGQEVLPAHERLAGDTVRRATRRALASAC